MQEFYMQVFFSGLLSFLSNNGKPYLFRENRAKRRHYDDELVFSLF